MLIKLFCFGFGLSKYILLISRAFFVNFIFGLILLEGNTKHDGYGFFLDDGEYDKLSECDSALFIISSSEFFNGTYA